MSAPLRISDAFDLTAEWERVEVLARCVAQIRNGRSADALVRLRELQPEVARLRGPGGPWRALPVQALGELEMDVLACGLAPELEPRIGRLFQSLRPGATAPYPTPSLLQELLGLGGADLPELMGALAENAPLRRLRLIDVEGSTPFEPIRPGPGVTARLLGLPAPISPPPGTLPVPERGCWDDLVLPPDRLALLRELCAWVRQRPVVVERWGGRAFGGPVALFTGRSGTGKTFAASVIASELGWPLYRVDLGVLVSKYIGETEKNLNRLFAAAHDCPMVLQFDEADSLFGKRAEVKDARDRYANMEIGHLLSRIELHTGPCILTTNLREHLDPAFARRIQVVVDFPTPDLDARARLWQHLLPPHAPREPGVDAAVLAAAAANLTGGAIRNAALRAATLAAAAGRPMALEHVALAIWREVAKDGRDHSRHEIGALAAHLPEDARC